MIDYTNTAKKSKKICRHCKKSTGNLIPSKTYWKGIIKDESGNVLVWTHKECETKEIKLQEAYDCQNIDADCNDCKFFKRSKLVSKDIWFGKCIKDKTILKNVLAYPNFCSGHECFVHRKNV